MKRSLVILLIVAFLAPQSVPVAFAQDLDLTLPNDWLSGAQVARTTLQPQGFEDKLVTWPDFNERMAYERDKTNDTIALVAFGLLFLLALNHGNSGKDGVDGQDGEDGKDGKPWRPCVAF